MNIASQSLSLARNPFPMKKQSFELLLIILMFFLPFCFAQTAFAHGDEPRLEISVERINPGGLIEVRGVGFDYDMQVSLSLISSTAQFSLNEVTTDEEGIFTQNVVLPAELPAGNYNFLARTEHHTVTSPMVTVWGTAVENHEDNGIQDQSDVQFDPIPTLAAGVPTPMLSSPYSQSSNPPEKTSLPLAWIALGVGIILILGVLIRMRIKR